MLGHFAKRLATCRRRYAAFIGEGMEAGDQPGFQRGGKDPRILGDGRFLEAVLGRRVAEPVEVPLGAIIAGGSADCGVSERELRNPSKNRRLSEARAVIGWRYRRIGAGTDREVAGHFRRDPSTPSRQIGGHEAKGKESAEMRDRL